MSTPTDPSKSPASAPPGSPPGLAADASPRDLLISRLVDSVARATDWTELGRIASVDTSIFTDLAHAHRIDRDIRAFAAPLMAIADRVSLPLSAASAGTAADPSLASSGTAPAQTIHIPLRHPTSHPARRGSFLGWAIAACLALALGAEFTGLRTHTIRTGAPSNIAGIVAPSFASTDQAINAYLELGKQQGKVLGEMPQKFVIQSQPAADGNGLEVVYLRQFIERAIVKDLYTLGTDELGRTILVPATAPKNSTPSSPL